MYAALARHVTHEIAKATPSVAVIAASGFMSLPWQQIGYVLGSMLIVLQGCYSIWKWRQEAKAARLPKPTVPPPSGP